MEVKISEVWYKVLTLLHGSKYQSLLFQESNLHLQVGFKVLIEDVLLNSGERPVASIVIVRQQLLCMFDPHTVMTATHAAVGGSRRWTLVRRPGRGTVTGFSALRGVSQYSRRS